MLSDEAMRATRLSSTSLSAAVVEATTAIRTSESPIAEELCGILTCVPAMRRQLELIRRFATFDAPVLIQGETGTGKELVARALHGLSDRKAQPLVTVDCAALPESLAESELFGHERGAFTGADRLYGGQIEAAAGGTLFLDEVNSLPLIVQGKLLRFLEQREFSRVGQRKPVRVDVRVISASNVPLERLVETGQMRRDFFHRLNVLRIDVPALRERLDDVSLLTRQFLADDEVARRYGITDVTEDVVTAIRALPWPGNIRELRNSLRRAVALSATRGPLSRLAELAPEDRGASLSSGARESLALFTRDFRSWMREREREYLLHLVARYGSVTQRAAAAGLPERTLYRKIRSCGLA